MMINNTGVRIQLCSVIFFGLFCLYFANNIYIRIFSGKSFGNLENVIHLYGFGDTYAKKHLVNKF